MEIEKINENKIRVTFDCQYLQKNNINLHSFMSNSIESQSLFLSILDQAERETGFITDNYKLSIELLAFSNGTFIINITRIEKDLQKTHRVHAHRKNPSNTSFQALIYKLSNYDDLISLENFLMNSDEKLFNAFSNSYLLYEYKDFIFLLLEKWDNQMKSKLSNIISEFAILIEDSEFVIEKIKEFGVHRKR